MKVSIADNSGFCFGVKRAVDAALAQKDSFSLGPLIHNPQTIKQLEERGIKAVETIDDLSKGTLLIRTHGVPGSVIKKAKEKGINVVDLTCPFVKKVHNYAIELQEEGYKVVVVGEKDHPEVEGIVGHVADPIVVENPEQAEKLKNEDKIGIVVQTTQNLKNLQQILEVVKTKTKNLKLCNTICSATTERQKVAIELAKDSDLMIVIGGKNSGNTRRLAELCSTLTETKYIESKDELKLEWFDNKSKIGIVAGASTPIEVILEVKDIIEGMS